VDDGSKRPWFGPKRIGYGLRPQTWQGWAITLVIALVVLAVAYLV
jgi:ABC-type dipeptide/oligopeptide/nickel transport system permease subunit